MEIMRNTDGGRSQRGHANNMHKIDRIEISSGSKYQGSGWADSLAVVGRCSSNNIGEQR